jgi:hypothetical protein
MHLIYKNIHTNHSITVLNFILIMWSISEIYTGIVENDHIICNDAYITIGTWMIVKAFLCVISIYVLFLYKIYNTAELFFIWCNVAILIWSIFGTVLYVNECTITSDDISTFTTFSIIIGYISCLNVCNFRIKKTEPLLQV